MFLDVQTQLSASQAFTGNGPNLSTFSYDLGAELRTGSGFPEVGRGEPLAIVLAVTVAAKVSGTNETYQFDVIQATDAGLTTSVDILATYPFTNALATSILVAGAILVMTIPPGHSAASAKRYLGYQESGTNTPTITCTAWIAPMDMVQKFRAYATNIIVL